MDPVVLVEQAGQFYISRLAQVPKETWGNPTPCPDWSVRDVAAHVMNGLATIAPLLAHQPVDPAERTRDHLGEDPVTSAHTALASALGALRKPGALEEMVTAPAGYLPGGVFAVIRAADTVIHTWDLTTGAGIDSTIPERLVHEITAASPPEILAGGRAAGVFGPSVDLAADADPEARLLAAYGRRAPRGPA